MHLFIRVFALFLCGYQIKGHGYLAVPGARNSMWRLGFNTPINYDDNELFCGGYFNQWDDQGGRCGLCGDPYQDPQPRKHEAGGVNAPIHRPISRCYNHADNVIDVTVRITAHHKGYFEFRLCENNNMASDPSLNCILNGRVLTIAGTQETRYDITNDFSEFFEYQLDLPKDVSCTQCILHWTYNAGNNWGCDDTGCGMGLGPQEQFINCADIAILPDCEAQQSTAVPTQPPEVPGTSTPWTTALPGSTTQQPEVTSTTSLPDKTSQKRVTQCWAIGVSKGDATMDDWCMRTCLDVINPNCPEYTCQCIRLMLQVL